MSDPFDCQRRFAKQGWAVSTGIAGQFQSEMLGSFNRNHWAVCAGIGGQFRPEYANIERTVKKNQDGD